MQNRPDTPADVRQRAEEARRLAKAIWPHAAAEALSAYAEELDDRADAMERAADGKAPPDEPEPRPET